MTAREGDEVRTTDEILREVAGYAAAERAAAIAHYVYMIAAERSEWGKRVPTAWSELPAEARQFNVDSVAVWARDPALLGAWNEAVSQIEI
jgi:hypothetical protein